MSSVSSWVRTEPYGRGELFGREEVLSLRSLQGLEIDLRQVLELSPPSEPAAGAEV